MPQQPSTQDIQDVVDWLKSWQDQLCQFFEQYETSEHFHEDSWTYSGKGGGRSRVLRNGETFEQAGVNFSHILGAALPAAASKTRTHLVDCPFQAAGVSLVIHPNSPIIPTTHANLRLFVADYDGDSDLPSWWFGGGFDLTPYYGFEDDCVFWHQCAQAACETLSPSAYNEFKDWCDRYFHLPHRKEQRGIGGIFFDDLINPDFATCFAFIRAVGENFIKAYREICDRRQELPYTPEQKEFQLYRRGRYTEFNLLYDRGTLFGLQSGGRTESILMSMPPRVRWEYNWQPPAGSEEARLTDYFLKPQDWANLTVSN
jgi:coproporphyrinogen III oxidase